MIMFMIFQQGGSSYDITQICMNAIGMILLISYIFFAYWVTHRGDFYHVRRWKASLWLASILVIILLAPLLFSSISTVFSNSPRKNIFEVITPVIDVIFSAFTLIIPLLFILTIGMHHQLKWWLNSDDFLDKIWKDPNKEHKSPIQDL